MTIPAKSLTTKQLAKRWSLTVDALESWRAHGYGPPYMKLGRWRGARVLYQLKDVEAYERRNMKNQKGKR